MTTNEMLNSDEFYDENGEPRVLTDEEAEKFSGKWSDPEIAKYFWWCMDSAEDMENGFWWCTDSAEDMENIE